MAKPPAVTLSFSPPGPDFPIDEQAAMPEVTAIATLSADMPSPTPPLYKWRVTLRSGGSGCQHSMGKVTSHPEIAKTTLVSSLSIPFTAVRGGELIVSVEVSVGVHVLTAISRGLRVVGTNPTIRGLVTATTGAPDAFKKLMRLESQLRQFRTPDCPLFSADNLGGVGLCQLTPPSSDDQVWDWKTNVSGGLALYREKERVARAYPAKVRASAEFKAQVKAYNDARATKAAAQPPNRPGAVTMHAVPKPPPQVTIIVPDYTPEQLELDTIRAFNGFAGGVHEYRLKTDDDDLLVVTLDATGRTGTVEWERIPVADRTAMYEARGIARNRRGDPGYVDDVLRQASF